MGKEKDKAEERLERFKEIDKEAADAATLSAGEVFYRRYYQMSEKDRALFLEYKSEQASTKEQFFDTTIQFYEDWLQQQKKKHREN